MGMSIADKYAHPPENVKVLFYHRDINRFTDEDGYILHDLSKYFDTWVLDQWKKTQDYGLLIDKNGDLWEIYYPEELDEVYDT